MWKILYLGEIDDIDDIHNKKINLIGEILNEPINFSINELFDNINKKLKKIEFKLKRKKLKKGNIDFQSIISSQILTNSIKRLFNSSPLSQTLEDINPITEITHKRKINFKNNGNSSTKNSNLEIREIHPSHYGKICPVETTEGKNAGLIWSLAKEARINKLGFIETPLFMWFLMLIKRKNH